MKEQPNFTPGPIRFDTTPEDTKTIHKIVARACKEFPGHDPISLAMDLSAAHLNGCPLDLARLLSAAPGDFGHDVNGINRFIDRLTGELTECFLPRCALPAVEVAQ